MCWAGWSFDAARVSAWIRDLVRLPGARRVKAVLRTTEGWLAFNFADGAEEIRPSGYRRDSRLELVVEGAPLPHTEGLERELQACAIPPQLALSS